MVKNYGELVKQAEKAAGKIKDKELRKEAFRILLLQFMATGSTVGVRRTTRKETTRKKRGPGRPPKKKKAIRKATRKVARKTAKKKTVKRPGRRGGGVVSTGLNRLVDAGYFKKTRDAATIFKEMSRRRIKILPSQLRMELLRFARSGSLKRRVKMKGRKVTYLYSKR